MNFLHLLQNFCKRHSRTAGSCQHHLAKVSLCHFSAANLNFCRWNDFRFASLNHRVFSSLPRCSWQSLCLFVNGFFLQIAQNENNTSHVCAFTAAAEQTQQGEVSTRPALPALLCHQPLNKCLHTGKKEMERNFKSQCRVSSHHKPTAVKGAWAWQETGAEFWDFPLASHCLQNSSDFHSASPHSSSFWNCKCWGKSNNVFNFIN